MAAEAAAEAAVAVGVMAAADAVAVAPADRAAKELRAAIAAASTLPGA
jgi:hypothetical protein